MDNYTIFQLFEASKQDTCNKCSEKSRSQIVFRTDVKLSKNCRWVPLQIHILGLERTDSIFLRNLWLQAMAKNQERMRMIKNLNIDEVKIILSKCT